MNIRYSILGRYTKRKGTNSIYVSVHLKNKKISFKTGVACKPEKFDREKGLIRGNSAKVKDDNLIIQNIAAQINDISVRYRLQSKDLTPELLKQEYDNPIYYIDFYLFMEDAISRRVKNKDLQPQSAKNHRTTLNKLKQFKHTLNFSEITPKLIGSFSGWCKLAPRKNKTNTVHKELKTFKTYLQIALIDGIIKVNPFEYYQLTKAKTDRVYLNENELKRLFRLYSSGTLTVSNQSVLRHFLFMCLTSIRISDLKRLEVQNYYDSAIHFIPMKTNTVKEKIIHINLSERAMQLIDDEERTGELLFEVISDQKMNKYIKDVMKIAKIHKSVTNHAARHTFGTLFIEKTSDVSTLQQIMGHSNIESTMVYVHISERKIKKQLKNFEKLLDI